MTPGQAAEARIAELGIRDPKDLDIEAIAFDAGVRVEYAPLTGCEATLVGYGSQAIATIRHSNVRGRERFSIGHEVGHWERHRGQSFRCRVDEPSQNLESNSLLEREADEFASHLLMPAPLFNPYIMAHRWPTLAQIEEVAHDFQSSQMATLIRIAKIDALPVIIAAYSALGKRWQVYAPHVRRRWQLKDRLDADSFAHDLLHKGSPCPTPRKQSADTWFVNDDAGEFEVLEQCYSPTPGQVVVSLYLSDAEMMDRPFDPNIQWRR